MTLYIIIATLVAISWTLYLARNHREIDEENVLWGFVVGAFWVALVPVLIIWFILFAITKRLKETFSL